ncbi:transposase family protein [Sanguibacter sp. 25GB23B1]|uniref:integrase catalytic domain-containing protein n=1 Tax=unclassified Sanguibacter TaxID=2645534 RepID=UPI0032AF0642
MAFVEWFTLTKPRPSIATLHRLAVTDAQQRGQPAPSYSTVREIVQGLDTGLVAVALEGQTCTGIGTSLYRCRAEPPNQTWQADHTELGVLIVGAGGNPDRPWLTVTMDVFSRAICGYIVLSGAPSAINTALALRQAIWRKPDPLTVGAKGSLSSALGGVR